MAYGAQRFRLPVCPSTSAKYEIRSIPVVKLFKNGKDTAEFIGALPESEVEKWLEKNIL